MLHISLNLNLLSAITSTFVAVTITNLTEKDNFNSTLEENAVRFDIDFYNNNPRVRAYTSNVGGVPFATYEGSQILNIASSGYSPIIKFAGNVQASGMTTFRNWIDTGLVELDQNGFTALQLFKLNDTRNKVTKTLTFYDIVEGKFKQPIGIKQITIDVVGYPIVATYNYVYIKSLNRYYYINDIIFVSADLTRLNLVEDVLMTWGDLIRGQSAFITRQENSTEAGLVDDRLPLTDELYDEIIYATDTEDGVVNTVFDVNCANTDMVFLTATKYYLSNPSSYDTYLYIKTPIAGSDLPSIKSHYSPQQQFYFMSYEDINDLIYACLRDDTTASFLDSILWLPFNPLTPFNLKARSNQLFYIGDKLLKSDGSFVPNTIVFPTSDQPQGSYQDANTFKITGCPYLVVFDGTFALSDDYINREPYCNYEIWIPFVGYVKLEYKDFANQRIIVYYSMDMRSGSASVYIYNVDNDFMIWSGGCQLGIKLDITATNLLENQRTKQSADLNTILGLVSSAVSVGVGVASGNPLAIAGGVLAGGKAIASNVNANLGIFNRASTTTGSNDGGLYQDLKVKMRATKHDRITITDSVYKKLNGLPYKHYESLSSLSGYTEIGDIQFDTNNNDIYNVEIDEIVALLKSGVIL